MPSNPITFLESRLIKSKLDDLGHVSSNYNLIVKAFNIRTSLRTYKRTDSYVKQTNYDLIVVKAYKIEAGGRIYKISTNSAGTDKYPTGSLFQIHNC